MACCCMLRTPFPKPNPLVPAPSALAPLQTMPPSSQTAPQPGSTPPVTCCLRRRRRQERMCMSGRSTSCRCTSTRRRGAGSGCTTHATWWASASPIPHLPRCKRTSVARRKRCEGGGVKAAAERPAATALLVGCLHFYSLHSAQQVSFCLQLTLCSSLQSLAQACHISPGQNIASCRPAGFTRVVIRVTKWGMK